MPKKGVAVLEELGAFLKQNGEAVYETRECAPYLFDNLAFTKKGKCVYAFYLYPNDEAEPLSVFEMPHFGKVKSVRMVSENFSVRLVGTSGNSETYEIPIRSLSKAPYADVFRIELV
ncbi:hypothetical protein D3C73_1270620 [compost metagenome]